MSLQVAHWENHLLNLAYEALKSDSPGEGRCLWDPPTLEQAYRVCDEITREHSRTFFLASGLLPGKKRRAIRALYAFCRLTDDLVDRANDEPRAAEELEAWRRRIVHPAEHERHPVILAWTDARQRYAVPVRYAEQLIHGVASDLKLQSYGSFQDLATYCYGVACTVGLMSMHIIGYRGMKAFPHAIRLGVALQLTNILRDVGEDWRAGRTYLPQEELEAFGLDREDIAQGVVNDHWREFMRYQIQRARALYEEALPGVAFLERDGRFAIAAAAELYRAILDDIEAHDYDVFTRRAGVSRLGKLRRLPGIWQRARRETGNPHGNPVRM
jgi:phytoene synthase